VPGENSGVSRRLAAILAADIAGYSALMGADEEGTVRNLKAHQAVIVPMIGQHGGRIIDTAGDGILAEFPSVLGAVKCALAIQRTMAERNEPVEPAKRMQYRIGINQGDVVVDDARAYGDGVNIAARLESITNPGGICVSGKVHDEIAGKIEAQWVDLGPQTLKNISQPIRVHRAVKRDTPAIVTRPALKLPDKPSIAVLPFTNLSGDKEQEYFSDGITEDIITELSRFSELFVIARNSSFQYKGQATDVRQVGRELGVRYVLEGSVRWFGDRIRVAAQLIDAESGGHLWAEKYDHDYADIFALQDRITESVVAAIEPEILVGESRRAARKSPVNLGAFDCCMRGVWHSNQLGPQDNKQAEIWLRRSIELDPTNARAHTMLARVLAVRCWAGYSDDIERDVQASQSAAECGLALDDRDPAGQYALSILSVMTRRHERALAAAQRAIDLNPNFALGYFALGETRVFMGLFAETLDPMMRCLLLTPRDPFASFYVSLIALAHYHLDNYEEAVRYSERALQRRRIYVVLRTLAATLGQLGRTEEARSVLAEMEQMKPINLKRHWELTCPYADPAHEAHLLNGLHKAGLTDHFR
jgi:adenylate cyclase